MGVYRNLVIDNLENAQTESKNYFPLPFPKLATVAGDIKTGQYTVVSGRIGSGKTSFVDYTYVINLFIEWRKLQAQGIDRPLKIFYFSLSASKQTKIQKWTSLFLYLKESLLIDVATLNSERSALLEITDMFKAQVEELEIFFDAMLETDVIEIFDGQQTPSSIYNVAVNYMETIGTFDVDEDIYTLSSDYNNSYCSIIVDSTDKLQVESTSYGVLSKSEIMQRMNEYAVHLKKVFKVSTILIHPTQTGIIRGPKDTEPQYANLGIYAQDCDKGFVMYNPFAEKNYNFANTDATQFISYRGINRLRMIGLLRNQSGPDNIIIRVGFYPENGFMMELPDHGAEDYKQIIEILKND